MKDTRNRRRSAFSWPRRLLLLPLFIIAGLALPGWTLGADDADNNGEALAALVEIGVLAEKKSDQLVPACEAFFAAYPDSKANEVVLFTLGKHQQSAKDYPAAIETLTAFIDRFPDSQLITEATMQRGEAYRLSQKPKESIPDFERAYAAFHEDGNNSAAHAMYHVVQAHKALGDEAAAKASFAILEKQYPDASYTTNASRLMKPASPQPSTAAKPAAPEIGDAAPDISFTHLDSDAQKKLSDFKGKVVVIDFWASWCGPCQAPMAKMQTYQEKHPEWGDKVELIALSIDNTAKAATDHLEKNGWDKTYNAWAGDGGFKSPPPTAYGIRGIPTCYIIDAEGKIAASGHPVKLDIPVLVDGLLKKE